MSKRQSLLSIVTNKKYKDIQSLFSKIRSDCIQIRKDKLDDPFKQFAQIERLIKKFSVKLFWSFSKTDLVVGRSFNNELIDMLKFKIVDYKTSIKNTVSAEMNMKYFLLIQNVKDERIVNCLVDIFNMKSSKVCLQNINYALVIIQKESRFTIKYCRVLSDDTLQDIGPKVELDLEDKYQCSDELYKKSLGDIKKKKKSKIVKNVFKDEVGTLHIDKQDLRDIKTRKYAK